MPTLLAIDGNSLMHRAFHAIPLLTADDGTYTNAVYGFMNMLLRLLKEMEPAYVAVAFDLHGPTIRHEEYAEYKAGRAKTPHELVGQFDLLKRLLRAMDIAVLEKEGYEADDILGTLSVMAGEKNVKAVLVTGDRDTLQLVNDHTVVVYTKRGITDTERLDIQGVKDKLGVLPERVTDLKGLMGDASDNIPGIPGVGKKTARKLLDQYGTMENALAHADEVSGKKLSESLVTYADQARLSKRLTVIETHLDGMPTFDALCFDTRLVSNADDIIRQYGMTSLMKRLHALNPDDGEREKAKGKAMAAITVVQLDSAQALYDAVKEAKTLAIHVDENGVSVFDGASACYHLAFAQSLLQTGLDESEVLPALSALFESENCEKILYDIKALRHRLANYDCTLGGPMQDVMLMAYVDNSSNGKDGLEKQCLSNGVECGERADAGSLWRLYEVLHKRMVEQETLAVYRDIELPLCDVLYDMEVRGFSLDVSVLDEMNEEYAGQIDAMQADIERLAGHPLNVNSPKQVGTVLYEELGLPASRRTKSGYSTDAASLDVISDMHPIVNKLLEYRQLSKLKSTYIDGLKKVADKKTGKVHTSFTQNVTATGRISSTEPNLQNIPVRTELGREIRRAFVAGAPGRVLISADYSQIELRLLAHMSQEEHMIDVFLSGGDIHAATAARVFGIALEDVTPTQRTAAKAVNFGIIYGISEFGLARNLGIARGEAGRIIEDYFQTYPRIREYMHACVAFARLNGYVETLYKRRRYLPELKSRNYAVRSFGERAAMNAPLQGTAADIIKVAMIRVEKELDDRVPDAQLILQVHDELIVDLKKSDETAVGNIVRGCMENIVALSVPLLVHIGTGENWLEAK